MDGTDGPVSFSNMRPYVLDAALHPRLWQLRTGRPCCRGPRPPTSSPTGLFSWVGRYKLSVLKRYYREFKFENLIV